MRRLRIPTAGAALAGYAAISFLYFGWRLLPHPGRPLNGASGSADPQKFVWWFEWWPHAILTGANPFLSYEVFAPTGINLAWTTSVPALALIFSPITLLFGPSMSYNLAAVLLPAVSAWTAFVLFRYLAGSVWRRPSGATSTASRATSWRTSWEATSTSRPPSCRRSSRWPCSASSAATTARAGRP